MTHTSISAHVSTNDEAAIHRRLDELLKDLLANGVDKNEQALILIMACLEEDITNGKKIVHTVVGLGFNARHVGKTLNVNIGLKWSKTGECYALLPSKT